ncbi:hypothetical protein SLS56_010670 [Neofusicoccum ribis]|uniref:Uncharacterized protein n=1 Tax=Neofusicoccum ribis TaxID=45134 RepID=A0ABR3SDU4_9PEZI
MKSGKVAIVTGASRGIGAAIALELAKRGANAPITYVTPSSAALADQVVSTIHQLGNGSSAVAIQADMAQADAPPKIVAATQAAFGPAIDILVNNAGVDCMKALADVTPADYDRCLDVNLRGVVFLTQAVLPHLRRPGRVVNIGSVGARMGLPALSVYIASKAGLEALTRGWAVELAPLGHTVNTVSPGSTDTDMLARGVEAARGGNVDPAEASRLMTPVGKRLGTGEDVALVVAMIAEPQSRWVTGQTISASGGLLMI